MRTLNILIKKVVTAIALLAVLGQSLNPYLYIMPRAAYAQEATVTPADSPTPTDSVTPTDTPTDTPAPTPTPDATATPTDTVTPVPTDTVTPTDTTTPTDSPTNQPADQSQNNQNNSNSSQSNNSSTPSPTVNITPTEAPKKDEKTGNENVSFVILKNVSAPSLDLQAANTQSSATLTTDKADYAPTDAAIITGTGLLPKTLYMLFVSSTDPPAVNFSTEVTSTDQGTFTYTYQLDGNYRPNYKAELKDSAGTVVASTTFTDSEQLTSVAVGTQSPASILPAASATYTISVTFSKSGGSASCTADLSVSGLTAGASGVFSPTSLTKLNGDATLSSTLTINTTGLVTTGTTSFTVTATGHTGTDCSGTTKTTTGTLVVTSPDTTPPTVNAGADQTKKATFTQVGSASDASGIANVAWTRQSGPGTITFGSSTATTTTVSASADGIYVLRLTATDNAFNTAFDEFTLVWDTTTPTVSVTTFSIVNNANKTAVTLSGACETGLAISLTVGSITASPAPTCAASAWTKTLDLSSLADGILTATATQTDTAGNVGTGTKTATKDVVAPTLSPVHIQSNNSNTSKSKVGDVVTVSFTASESVTGTSVTVGSHAASLTGSGSGPYSATYTMTSGDSEGAVVFSISGFSDTAGNTGSAVSATTDSSSVTFDKTAPVVTITNPATSPAQSKTITASTNEGTLSMSNTTGSVCDGTLTFIAYSSQTFTSESDNGKQVCYRAVDTAGNTTYNLSLAIAGIDTTAPVTTITTVTDGNSNVLSSNQTTKSTSVSVAFNATDTSGIASSDCKIDAGVYSTCTSPKVYPSLSDGNHTVSIRSTDNAGNIESTATFTWIVDTTPPVLSEITPVTTPTNDNTPNYTFSSTEGGGVTYTGDCVSAYAAANSGNNSVTFNTLSDGVHSNCTITVTDGVGNASTPLNVSSFRVDTVAPNLSSKTTFSGWYNANQTSTFTYADAGSGIVSGTPVTCAITTEGSAQTCSVTPNVCDAAGNCNSTPVTSNGVNIDTTNPTVPGAPSTTSPTNSTTQNWSWTAATDAVSNVASYAWRAVLGATTINNSTTTTSVITSLTEGIWNFFVKAIDNAGNQSSEATNSVTVDTTAPTTPVATPGTGNYTSAGVNVTLSSSDSLSGLDKMYYTIDGSDPSIATNSARTLYSTAITVDHDMTIKAVAYDNAGNPSSILSATYGIPPIISAETSASITDTLATITWTTDDPATSRVIYGTAPVSDTTVATFSDGSNYGYSNSTVEDSTKVLAHSVIVSGLSASTTYYYRTVSHGSPETVGSEQSFSTTATSSNNSGGGGSSSGGGGGSASAPVCGDTKPGSAPRLLSATATGTNQITLTWDKGSSPVSYYLVTFGTKPGEQLYGNPNVGGSDTTSYTISHLSGGKTYYFKVRAGNGCQPGDYSNEVSGSPTGGFVAGLPGGFAQGVLGAKTQAKITPTGVQKPTAVLGASSPKSYPTGVKPGKPSFFSLIFNFFKRLFGGK